MVSNFKTCESFFNYVTVSCTAPHCAAMPILHGTPMSCTVLHCRDADPNSLDPGSGSRHFGETGSEFLRTKSLNWTVDTTWNLFFYGLFLPRRIRIPNRPRNRRNTAFLCCNVCSKYTLDARYNTCIYTDFPNRVIVLPKIKIFLRNGDKQIFNKCHFFNRGS